MLKSIFVSVQTDKSVPLGFKSETCNVCVLFKITNTDVVAIVDRDNNLFFKRFSQLIIKNNENQNQNIIIN